jgi:hypothetical protein
MICRSRRCVRGCPDRPGIRAGHTAQISEDRGDLPALSYQSAAAPADLIRSQEAFSPLGHKLRVDIGLLLRDYSIEGRTTLRGLHSTLLELDMMENRADDARKEIAVVRDLQDKPAAKTSGILEEALLTSGGVKANRQGVFPKLLHCDKQVAFGRSGRRHETGEGSSSDSR